MIYVNRLVRLPVGLTGEIRRGVRTLLRKEVSGGILGISLVNDRLIRYLNRKFRNKDKPTDVLAFPLKDRKPLDPSTTLRARGKLLGDVVVSVDTVRRNAKKYGVSFKEELLRVALHGVLHLLGYNHRQMKRRGHAA